jgi:hypothetical protein
MGVADEGLSGFSDEILLEVVGHLGCLDDLISLSETSSRFAVLLEDGSLLSRLRLEWQSRTSRRSLLRFLAQPNRASFLTHLTLNDLYSLPSGLIRDIALKLNNLRVSPITFLSLKRGFFGVGLEQKGAQRNISKFFSTKAKKIFLWIYTFQAILRPFYLYTLFFQNFEIF